MKSPSREPRHNGQTSTSKLQPDGIKLARYKIVRTAIKTRPRPFVKSLIRWTRPMPSPNSEHSKLQSIKNRPLQRILKRRSSNRIKLKTRWKRVRLVGAVAQGYTKLEQPNDAKQIMASALKLGEAEKDPAKKARLLALIGRTTNRFPW